MLLLLFRVKERAFTLLLRPLLCTIACISFSPISTYLVHTLSLSLCLCCSPCRLLCVCECAHCFVAIVWVHNTMCIDTEHRNVLSFCLFPLWLCCFVFEFYHFNHSPFHWALLVLVSFVIVSLSLCLCMFVCDSLFAICTRPQNFILICALFFVLFRILFHLDCVYVYYERANVYHLLFYICVSLLLFVCIFAKDRWEWFFFSSVCCWVSSSIRFSCIFLFCCLLHFANSLHISIVHLIKIEHHMGFCAIVCIECSYLRDSLKRVFFFASLFHHLFSHFSFLIWS